MAYLTEEDLQYEDVKYKKWWSEQYGYDFALNANIQSNIHKLVLEEVSVGLESMAGEKSFAPRPANYNIGGVSFVITADDRDAYCARYPQACKTGKQREDALKALKSGKTFAPASEPEPAEEQPSEEKVVVEEPVPPVEEDATTQQTPQATPVFPEPSTTPSHRVKTNGSTLSLRDAPSSVGVSEIASQDTDKKGELIEKLPNGTSFVVLDPGVGYLCEWHHVRYGTKEGYLYNKFTEALDSSYLEYDCETPYDSVFNLSADWTTKEPNVPYEDKTVGKWCVPYETEHESTGGHELQNRMVAAIQPATYILLTEIGKENTDEYVSKITAAPAAVRAEDYYVSERPGESMRVLVTLPIKYISKLEDQLPTIEDQAEPTDGEVFSGDVYSERSDIRKGTTRQTILYLDPSASYKDRLKRVAAGMRGYATQVDNFNGEVKNLDFRKEADRFEGFVESFNKLLSANGAPTTGAHSIELGLDPNFVGTYAAENSAGFYKAMKSGWETFKDNEPADSPRSMRYLFYLWDMEQAIAENMDWIEFVGRFTDYELVEIYPSASGNNSVDDVSSMWAEENPSSSGQTTADQVDKEISPEEDMGEGCFENVSIKGLAQDLMKKSKSLKNPADKLKEDLKFSGADLRRGIRNEALATVDFVGEPILGDIHGSMAKITELDDVFDVVLNKISLMDLVGAILACFNVDFKLDIDLPLPLRLDCLSLPTIPTIELPDDLPTMDIMADLSTEVFQAIVQALTEAFVEMIKDLVISMTALCKEEAEDTAADINEAIDDAAKAASMNDDEAKDKADENKKAVLGAMGLLTGPFNTPLSDAEKKARLGDLQLLLGDISLMITPSELCRLLKGRASSRTLSIVRSLINKKYPTFASKLKTKTKIKDFMILIGRMVNSEFCESLANSPSTKYGADTTCISYDTAGSPAAQSLRAKAGGITEDQVLEQLARAKQRKEQRSKDLADILGKLLELQSGRGNPFQDAMPPLMCGKNADGTSKPGLLQLKHDSLDFMMDKVMDTVFDPIYMSFNRDISSYQSVMITNTNEKKEVKAAFQTENDKWMWHPEIKRQEAMGMTFDFNEDFGKAASNHGDKSIEVDEGVRRVNTSTRSLLNNLEGSGAFTTKLDNEGVYYELVLPPDPNTRSALEQISKQFESFTPEALAQAGAADFDIDKFMQVLPDWRVRYKIPWQANDKDQGQLVDDEYIIEIFPGEDPEETDLGLRREIEKPVVEEARNYIASLYADKSVTQVFTGDDKFTVDPQVENLASIVTPSEFPGMVNVEIRHSEEDPCNPDVSELVTRVTVPGEISDLGLSATQVYQKALGLSGPEQCDFILQFIGREQWEYEPLKEIYENAGCWNFERMQKLPSYSLPPQAEVFGRHAEKVWRDGLDNPTDDDTKTFLNNIKNYYATFVHPQVTSDILSMMAKQVASSMLFDSQEVILPAGSGESKMTSTTPYLEKIVFAREPDKWEKACGIDPHLLSVQDFKKAAKDDFENSGGFCSLTEDLDDDTKQDPIRAAMLKSVAQMTIRCYIIDYFLRGIFAFTEFAVEQTMDDYVLEFMLKKMVEELRSYEGPYAELFLEYISTLPGSPPEPSAEDIDAPAHDDGLDDDEYDTHSDPEEVFMGALKGLFVEEFATVAVEIRDVLHRDEVFRDKISYENSISLHERLIQEWIPVIDLPDKEGEVRFSNVVKKTLESDVTATGVELDAHDIVYATNKTSFDNGLAFDLSNGNLFLEKFYKLVKKDISPLALAQQLIEDFGANGFDDNAIAAGRTTYTMKAVDKAWDQAMGEEAELYLGVRQIDNKIDSFIGAIVANLQAGEYLSGATVPGSAVLADPIKYFDNVDQLFSPTNTAAQNIWKVENFFSSIETGLRLCYVHPVDVDSSDHTSFAASATSLEKYFDNSPTAKLEGTPPNIVGLVDKYKSFYIKEEYSPTGNYENGAAQALYNPNGTYQTAPAPAIRRLFTTPLIEVLDDQVYGDMRESSLMQISGSWLTGSEESGQWMTKHDASLTDLKDALIETEEYAALFKYSIPTERFLGLLTVYTMMSVSAAPNVEALFGGTKDELMRAFLALLNTSYKASEGPSNSDMSRLLDHFNGISTPCFSFSWGGGGSFKGFGMDLILKLAIKTPLLVFKAVVEMIDPNIKIAKWIIDLAKFIGICLPMPAISLGLLPPTVFGFPPFGIGIGPLLTPLGFGYLALGFEIPGGNPFKNDDEDPADVTMSKEKCDLIKQQKQDAIDALKEKILSATQK